MKKLIGSNKLKTAVFISGKGSNFKNLINYSLKKNSIIEIKVVISNNSKAKGLNFANKHNIKTKLIPKSSTYIKYNANAYTLIPVERIVIPKFANPEKI